MMLKLKKGIPMLEADAPWGGTHEGQRSWGKRLGEVAILPSSLRREKSRPDTLFEPKMPPKVLLG